jgi:hypothetical protein
MVRDFNMLSRGRVISAFFHTYVHCVGKTWEYQYRYGESTPRSLATGGPTGGGDGLGSLNEGLEGEDLPSPIPILARPSTSPSEAGVNYTTASTAAGYETNLAISHLSRNLGQIRVDSSLSQDDSSGYGAQQRSMVDDSGIPIPRAQQNPQGYAYSKSPPNAQSSFPSSRKTPQMLCMSDTLAD